MSYLINASLETANNYLLVVGSNKLEALQNLAATLPTAIPDDEIKVIQESLSKSVVETLLMTVFASLFTVILGAPLGLLTVSTGKEGLTPNRALNHFLSTAINVGRSIPFIILMIALMPITRLIAGTTLGWKAALIPLTVAAIPFFARLVESNVRAVEPGKIEAARMMGATRLDIMFGVQLREALPSLVQSITVLIISILGFSAMAGTLGSGGLGSLVYNYGYTRFMTFVMIVSVAVVILVVQVIQMIGDMISRLVDHR